jgi:hypothetical protein
MTHSEADRPRATGGCLCGAVCYEVSGPLRDVIVCHCGQCRRAHGHVAAYSAARREHLRILEDSELRWYHPKDHNDSALRGFCGVCGASLFWHMPDSATVSIAAGTLDLPTGLRTIKEIYTEDASDYYTRRE